MRCLALASKLREKGEKIAFICRDLPGNLIKRVEMESFPVKILPSPANFASKKIQKPPPHAAWLGVPWEQDAKETQAIVAAESSPRNVLAVDHYAIDARWEAALSGSISTILVIDDLEDRPHSCQVLLNQNLCFERSADPNTTTQELRGPAYALLRPEFSLARHGLDFRNGDIRRVNIFFGGTDPTNETMKALRGILPLVGKELEIDVILGATNPYVRLIQELHSQDPSRFHLRSNVMNMAELLASADIAIGASGTSTWERACLGVPALNTIIADNQRGIAKAAHEAGISVNLGEATVLSEQDYAQAFLKIRSNPNLLRQMSRAGMNLVDGLGTERVVKVLREPKNDYDSI